jgi:hypothetical protein
MTGLDPFRCQVDFISVPFSAKYGPLRLSAIRKRALAVRGTSRIDRDGQPRRIPENNT